MSTGGSQGSDAGRPIRWTAWPAPGPPPVADAAEPSPGRPGSAAAGPCAGSAQSACASRAFSPRVSAAASGCTLSAPASRSAPTTWPRSRAGRTRSKIENEASNCLARHGYNDTRNCEHGCDGLVNLFATLNLLAFALQLVLDCVSGLWRQCRDRAGPRRALFEQLHTNAIVNKDFRCRNALSLQPANVRLQARPWGSGVDSQLPGQRLRHALPRRSDSLLAIA